MDRLTLEAARSGDRQAIGRLLSALQDTWYRFCLANLRDPDRAADAVQETGLRFIRQISGFRGDSELTTWSLGIALNVVREIRRKKTGESLDDEQDDPITSSDVSDPVEQRESQQAVHAILDRLPARQREVVVLRFFQELSTEQTALAMNCATGTVKATLHQALRALKQKLTHQS